MNNGVMTASTLNSCTRSPRPWSHREGKATYIEAFSSASMTVGTRSATRPSPTKRAERSRPTLLTISRPARASTPRVRPPQHSLASRAFVDSRWRWRLEQRSRATLKTRQKHVRQEKIDLFVVPNPDRSGPGGFLRPRTFGFLDSQVAGYVGIAIQRCLQIGRKGDRSCPLRHRDAEDGRPAKQLAVAIQKAAIKTLIANGTYGAILKHYGVTAGGLRRRKSSSTGHSRKS